RLQGDWSSDVCSSDLRDLERSVGDLDVREALVAQPLLELVHASAAVDGLEQCPPADDRRLERAVERDFLLEVVGDIRRPPAELRSEERRVGKECRAWG